MLYPLSYEGLRSTFALDTGRVSVRWAWAYEPAPDGLCRVPCDQVLITCPSTRG
jgi:hypothetical protein